MCIFNAVKGNGFIVDALFSNFSYLHNLYTVVELYTIFVLIHFESQQPPIYLENTCDQEDLSDTKLLQKLTNQVAIDYIPFTTNVALDIWTFGKKNCGLAIE